MKNSLIWQVLQQSIAHWDSLQQIRYLRVTGLKQGSEVKIYAPWTGVVLDSGVSEHGLFLSKIQYKENRNYQITVRNQGYQALSVPATGSITTVRMLKDRII